MRTVAYRSASTLMSVGAGAVLADEAYHTEFPAHILLKKRPICHLEVLNAMVALITWVAKLCGKLGHLYCDNTTAVVVFHAGHGRDPFLQACARQLWFLCARHEITLGVGHMTRECLVELADTLSCWHAGHLYKDRVDQLIKDRGTKFHLQCLLIPMYSAVTNFSIL